MPDTRKSVAEITAKIERIPTLPVLSREIMALLDDDTADYRKITALIEKDQALAADILKIANSSFFSPLNRVGSIDHALAILGLAEVKSILLAFSASAFFSDQENSAFDRSGFWRHSIVVSQIARYLARQFQAQEDDSVFLSGLIHDLGKVVIDQYLHQEFLQIVDYVNLKGEPFSAAEKEVLGVTHYQVAAKLLQQWKFPRRVVWHVFYHHAPWYDRNHTAGSIVIYLANIFAKTAGYSCLATERTPELTIFDNPGLRNFLAKNGFEFSRRTPLVILNNVEELLAAEGADLLAVFDRGRA